MVSSFVELPEEIILLILRKLTVQELAHVAIQSRQLRHLTDSDALWKELYSKKLLSQDHQVLHFDDGDQISGWKQCYRVMEQTPAHFYTIAQEIHDRTHTSLHSPVDRFVRTIDALTSIQDSVEPLKRLPQRCLELRRLLKDLHYWFDEKAEVIVKAVRRDAAQVTVFEQKRKSRLLPGIQAAMKLLLSSGYMICPSIQFKLHSWHPDFSWI